MLTLTPHGCCACNGIVSSTAAMVTPQRKPRRSTSNRAFMVELQVVEHWLNKQRDVACSTSHTLHRIYQMLQCSPYPLEEALAYSKSRIILRIASLPCAFSHARQGSLRCARTTTAVASVRLAIFVRQRPRTPQVCSSNPSCAKYTKPIHKSLQ